MVKYRCRRSRPKVCINPTTPRSLRWGGGGFFSARVRRSSIVRLSKLQRDVDNSYVDEGISKQHGGQTQICTHVNNLALHRSIKKICNLLVDSDVCLDFIKFWVCIQHLNIFSDVRGHVPGVSPLTSSWNVFCGDRLGALPSFLEAGRSGETRCKQVTAELPSAFLELGTETFSTMPCCRSSRILLWNRRRSVFVGLITPCAANK